MECGAVRALDGRRPRAGRRALHRRARARLQRQPDPATTALRGAPAPVSARHDPLLVVNPDYRHLDGQVRSATGKLTRRLARFAAMTLEEPIEPKHVEPFVRHKAALQEEIETLQHELETLKARRKQTPHHITVDELPEEARFRQLSTQSKHLVDTIKMVAYRAETAMANSLREHLTRPDEARRVLRALYTTEADLVPDPDARTLTVRLHHCANAATDRVIDKPCST